MPAQIFHADLYGTREHKYEMLLRHDALSLNWAEMVPNAEFQLFVPQAGDLREEYQQGTRITEVFRFVGEGFKTHRDAFAVAFNAIDASSRLNALIDKGVSDDMLREQYNLEDTKTWHLKAARTSIRALAHPETIISRCLYRPFDYRFCLLDPAIMDRPRTQSQSHLRRQNLAISTTRSVEIQRGFEHVFCTNAVSDHHAVSLKEANYTFPLFFYSDDFTRRPNFTPVFAEALNTKLNFILIDSVASISQDTDPNLSLLGMFSEFHGVFNAELTEEAAEVSAAPENTVTPEDIFHYAYAIFHSPSYRERYAEFLKIDFPRLPLTADVPLFRALAALGEQLTALHLMERVGQDPAGFPVSGSNSVDAAPKYEAGEQRVYINKTQYFAPVPPEVWAFQIGGYQVCHKWLKDRKGRVLTEEDSTHYGQIVAALGETIRLMADIDAVIVEHGDWPLQ